MLLNVCQPQLNTITLERVSSSIEKLEAVFSGLMYHVMLATRKSLCILKIFNIVKLKI